jgi:hypothetical protein
MFVLAAKLTGWRIDVRSILNPQETIEGGLAEASEESKETKEEENKDKEIKEEPEETNEEKIEPGKQQENKSDNPKN